MNKKIKGLELFGIFFYVGLFTLGGGYAMIPLMKQELIEKHKYISDDDFIEVFAISQTTPGPIAVNIATFIGFAESGIFGSIMATLGVTLPSLIIILCISMFFKGIASNIFVHKFFLGILTGVVAEIAYVTVDMSKKMKLNFFNASVFVLSLIEIFVVKINPIYVLLIGGFIGILFKTKDFKNAPH